MSNKEIEEILGRARNTVEQYSDGVELQTENWARRADAFARALISHMEPIELRRIKRPKGNADFILCACYGHSEIKPAFRYCPSCGHPLKWEAGK